ncbi:hypothetical protein ACFVU3_19885 [Streptomyces sp. NPDC058052]|uniref:hypothetical protein n=1 Tax=Streptomyces sp. NPDC058052 TaxID=3346316 RepID=UPI0036EF9379
MSAMDPGEELRRDVAAARARFAEEGGGATTTVLRNDGPYRHVRFDFPRASWRWCEVVTWPDVLVLRGDLGVWSFGRPGDGLEGFRLPGGEAGRVDPARWAERLVSGGPGAALRYCAARAAAYVRAAVTAGAERHEGLAEEAEEFFFGARAGTDLSTEKGLLEAVGRFEERHADVYEGFRFPVETWEPHRYDPGFLLACVMLPWAVAEYDAAASAVSRVA